MDVETFENVLWLAFYGYSILEIGTVSAVLVLVAVARGGHTIVLSIVRSSHPSLAVYLLMHLMHYGTSLMMLMLPYQTRQSMHTLNSFSVCFLWWFCYLILTDVHTAWGSWQVLRRDLRRWNNVHSSTGPLSASTVMSRVSHQAQQHLSGIRHYVQALAGAPNAENDWVRENYQSILGQLVNVCVKCLQLAARWCNARSTQSAWTVFFWHFSASTVLMWGSMLLMYPHTCARALEVLAQTLLSIGRWLTWSESTESTE